MREISLVLLAQDDATPIAELVWSEARTRIVSATEAMRPELERRVGEGLLEWIGHPDDPIPRSTASSDPLFLERLAAYLHRRSSIKSELRDSGP